MTETSVQHINFKMQLHYLLVVVVVSDVIGVKVASSTVNNYNSRTKQCFSNRTELIPN